jgi:hypothetical protein
MLRCAARDAGHRVLTIALVGAVLALAGACSSSKHTKDMTINEREYAPYRNPGTGVVVGQVTMTLKSGETLGGAACEVRLSPVTDETTRYMQDVVMAGGTKPWKDRSDAVWWTAQADDEGRFRFEQVPSGSYYLTCPVAWRSPGSGDTHSRILWAETTVGPNETVTVSVSR